MNLGGHRSTPTLTKISQGRPHRSHTQIVQGLWKAVRGLRTAISLPSNPSFLNTSLPTAPLACFY